MKQSVRYKKEILAYKIRLHLFKDAALLLFYCLSSKQFDNFNDRDNGESKC